jgi:hypothetical protein
MYSPLNLVDIVWHIAIMSRGFLKKVGNWCKVLSCNEICRWTMGNMAKKTDHPARACQKVVAQALLEAAVTGLPKTTIHDTMAMVESGAVPSADLSTTQKVLAASCFSLAAAITGSIDQETIEEAGLRDRVVSAGILVDKGRLMSGLATEHHAHAHKLEAAHSMLSSRTKAGDK